MNLRLLQISDSALPISGYTHSWGLEGAIARGLVRDAETLEGWTLRWLRTSLGPLEGVLVASACREARTGKIAGLRDLNLLADATMVAPTLRTASREMGGQLLALAATWAWSAESLRPYLDPAGGETRHWHHPVAFGLLGAWPAPSPTRS
ncbi:MAG: urease accessory UreF family protein [Isosphaeraceae bacterium]